MLKLADFTLLRNHGFVDGKWIHADDGAVFPVTNPADNSVIVQVAALGQAETRRAIEAANAALPAWKAKTAKERATILRKWFELILANAEDLAVLMSAEQ
ncbi:MAG: aldehyde dehydrogenase family protein, partial [Magnetospirillum sp.]